MKSLFARFCRVTLTSKAICREIDGAARGKRKTPRHNLPRALMLGREARRCTFPRHIRRLTRWGRARLPRSCNSWCWWRPRNCWRSKRFGSLAIRLVLSLEPDGSRLFDASLLLFHLLLSFMSKHLRLAYLQKRHSTSQHSSSICFLDTWTHLSLLCAHQPRAEVLLT